MKNFIWIFNCTNFSQDEKSKVIEPKTILDEHKPFACRECGKRFRQKGTMKTHIEIVHEGKKKQRLWTCSVCTKSFNQKVKLRNHQLKAHDIKANECSICNIGFEHKKGLIEHLAEKHEITKPFECSICQRGCVNQYSLDIHISR